MADVAVLRLLGPRLHVVVCASLGPDLSGCGLVSDGDGSWIGPPGALEPVCTLLDRLGFHWGVYDPGGARTFAERLFAECPGELASGIYEALRPVLASTPGTDVVLAALDMAWEDFGDRSGGSR